jgi:3-hydroxyacyl-CoA dehydrogenase
MESIKRAAVLGLGTMGHGIAQTMALAGCEVRGYDASPDARDSLRNRVRANLEQMLAVGLVEEDAVADAVGRVTVCDNEAEALAGAEFVTEAVVEDLAVKQELFERIESAVEPKSILASNTSSYPMTDISTRMQHPERALVTHWFNPPHIIPVVEVVPGEKTSDEITQTTYNFLDRIGKTPVRLNQELPGFLVNRVQVAMFREVLDLLDRKVASPEEIDRAIRGSAGMRLAALGPLAIIDYAGLDVTSRVYQNLVPHLRSNHDLPLRIGELVEQGHYGAKTGEGVFEYPPESIEQQVADRNRLYLELVKLMG